MGACECPQPDPHPMRSGVHQPDCPEVSFLRIPQEPPSPPFRGGGFIHTPTAAEVEALRAEVRELRAEVESLKAPR